MHDYLTLVDDSYTAILPHLLRVTGELGICDTLAHGQLDVAELASALQADAGSLRRLLRALTSLGILDEPEPDHFSVTEIGQRLRSDTEDSIRESLVNLDTLHAWIGAADAIRSGNTAFNHLYSANFFAHKDSNSDANRSFLLRMRERANSCYGQISTFADWCSAHVILDIGGGDGYLLKRILACAPHVGGMLFDRRSVISLVEDSGHLAHLSGRCTLVAGDFFEELPSGADVHLMCSILHDWPDTAAAAILRNSRKALAPAGRLLIVEMIIPSGNGWHPSKLSDIGMMVLTSGKERTESEFVELLESSGYQLSSVRRIPGSYFSLLEAV